MIRYLTLGLPISNLCENYLSLLNSHLCEMQWRYFVGKKRQPEWSVTLMQCSLAF